MSLRKKGLGWLQCLGIAITSAVGFHPTSSVAQITPDGTLPTNSNVTSEGNRRTITGGTQAGKNLFHSFRDFSVPTGSEAFFNNSADIQNIINRVTGGSISDIDGLIRANGGANLFLINPNGIVFGPNARLNIGGSFYGTSANSMKFSDGSEFSAVNPQSPPLLTINLPVGLQYGTNPGNITVGNEQTEPTDELPATLLEVPTGKTLALVGGDVNVNGQRLRAPGGRIELGGLTSEGTVGINNDGSLTFPDGVKRADVSLNGGQVDVTAGGGGSVGINARNINLRGGSDICAGIGGDDFCGGLTSDTGSVESQAGDITLNATADITGDRGVLINNRVNPGATGNSGNINIQAGSLSMTEGARVSASTLGQGDAGSVTINANDLVKFDGSDPDGNSGGALSAVGSEAVGNAGGVSITTASLEVLNGAQLNASTSGQGDAGSVTINANNLVKFDGKGIFPSGAFSIVNPDAVGKAGGVSITTGSLEVLNGAQTGATTFGQGDAGSVTINANDLVKFDGVSEDGFSSGVGSDVGPDAVGNAGGVSITTGSLEVLNGSQVSASTLGQGDAGSVTINANNLLKLDGVSEDGFSSGVGSEVGRDAVGNAGGVSINTGFLEVLNGARVSTNTFGKGNAGSVTINASNLVKFDGEGRSPSRATSTVEFGAEGKAGGVSITTGSLEVLNGSQVSASTFGQGDAGTVTINANDLVKFDGEGRSPSGATSTVESEAVGKAGGVSITTDSLEVLNGAQVGASTLGQGDAGSVTINANDLVKFDGVSENGFSSGVFSTIEPDAVGNAGGISITTDSLEVLNGAQVSASTFGQGDAGTVTINANDLVKFDGERQDGNPTGATSTVESEAVGNAGGISITTGSLEVLNGAQVNASSLGQGNAGTVTINANDLVKFDGERQDGNPSGVFSQVGLDGVGNAGDVSITTASLEVLNGAQVNAITLGQGDAGTVTINADDLVKFDGKGGFSSGAFSQVESGAKGSGGGVSITTSFLEISNGAALSAQSLGEGNAGDLDIDAKSIRLDNNGIITANTQSADEDSQANINIRSQDLILRRGSNITANAIGNGGNISINTGVLAGFENSNITANSRDVRGGNVLINAEGIFGLQFRDQLSPLSDITATGVNNELSGNVEIDTTEADPTRGLGEVEADTVDASNQISDPCTPGNRGFGNSFVSIGRGGLPITPTEPLQDTSTISTWVKLKPQASSRTNKKTTNRTTSSRSTTTAKTPKVEKQTEVDKPTQIVEATGWIVNAQGNIEFVAQANHTNPKSPWQNSASCSVSEK